MLSFSQLLKEKKMTLIVSLPSNSQEVYDAAVEGGADVIKLHINVEHRASGNRFGTLEENIEILQRVTANRNIPVGIVPGDSLEKINHELIESLINLKLDFVSLYAHHTPPWLLNEQRLSKMVAINNEYSTAEAISLTWLPIDMLEASIMRPEQYGTPLSVQDLASYRLLTQSIDKPVVVPTQKLVHDSDIETLYQTGVKGLMIGAIVTGHDPESIYRKTKLFKDRINEITSNN